MNNIDKGSVKYLIISIIAISIAGIILYPVLDFLYTKYITRSAFNYSITQHVVAPIVIGTIIEVCLWLFGKYSSKNKK